MTDCAHPNPWVITGSGGAWCYVCGAIKLINGLWYLPTKDADVSPCEEYPVRVRLLKEE